jgi:hypothetical protein
MAIPPQMEFSITFMNEEGPAAGAASCASRVMEFSKLNTLIMVDHHRISNAEERNIKE